MKSTNILLAGTVGAFSVLAANQALAQKSQDVLRFAITEPYKGLSGYFYPATEASQFYRTIYQMLIRFDEYKGKLVPQLAKSWKRIDDTTIEFELRDDVKFHNGNAFNADYVLYAIKMAADPKNKFAFKGRFKWIKNAEKLGPYKVRVTGKKLNAGDFMHFAYRSFMIDAETHRAHANGADYGRMTPVGTGAYKVVDFDRNRGVTVERFAGFKGIGRAPIKRVKAVFIPDQETQIAQLLTGGVDVVRNISNDNAKGIEGNSKLSVSAVDSITMTYFMMDAAGRSGKKELTDLRVRKALAMAINRRAIKKAVIPGGKSAKLAKALCFASMVGCTHSVETAPYDPAAAKRLLAEAGYPNGFDLEITAHIIVKDVATAIAGDLRKIGVRASIQPMTTVAMRKKRASGKMQAFSGYYPNGSLPDVANALNVYFGAKSRDYARDPVIHKGMNAGKQTHDLAARKAAYGKVFDRISRNAYIVPIASLPIIYGHSSEISVKPNLITANELHISDFFWK